MPEFSRAAAGVTADSGIFSRSSAFIVKSRLGEEDRGEQLRAGEFDAEPRALVLAETSGTIS